MCLPISFSSTAFSRGSKTCRPNRQHKYWDWRRRMVDWSQARQLFRDGLDTLDIAKHFGVHESVVYNGLAVEQARRSNGHVLPASQPIRMEDLVRDGSGLRKRQKATVV